jgi:diguanylate cyclase (GGDEF)-like protein
VDWASYLEPRDRDEAKRTAATLFIVAAGVTLLFDVIVPPPGGPAAKMVTLLVPVVLIGLALLLLKVRTSQRRLLALWAPAPIVGILVIAGMDLATSDSSAAGQVFLCYPVIYAASQLRAPAAYAASLVAIVADATIVFALEPMTPALTDLCYVSAALLSMTALLVRAGRRQDALVLELRRQAAVDPLTGLATRRVLDDAVRTALTSDDSDGGTALGMLDIDRFKSVNDRYGHPVGDAALVHIANVLAAHTRPDTIICRIGGDEIAFLLPGCTQQVALKRAEHLVQAIRENPLRLAGGELLRLSASIGIAHAPLPHDDETMRALYASADSALYHAKRAGRDRVGVPAGSPGGQPSLTA